MTNDEARTYLIVNGYTDNDEMADTIVSNIKGTSSFSEYMPYNRMTIPNTTTARYPCINDEVYALIK